MKYTVNPHNKNRETIHNVVMDVQTLKVYVFYRDGKEVARFREDELVDPPIESLDVADEERRAISRRIQQLGSVDLGHQPHLE